MSLFSKIGRFKLLIVILLVVLIVAVGVVVLNSYFPESNSAIKEAENDLQVNVPLPSNLDESAFSNSKGMVDLVSASLEKNQSTLEITVQVKDPIKALSSQEAAQFDVITVLENEDDVLQTYDFIVDVNSTGLFCLVQNVETNATHIGQFTVAGNKFTITTTLDELGAATKAEWSIYSTYDRFENSQVIYSVYDLIPDEGLKTTVFIQG